MAEVNDSVEFLPGFSNFRGTKPGAVLQNPVFHLTFSQVLLNGKRSEIVSRGFEGCYDWSDMMNILIDSLSNFEDIETSEELAMEDIKSWFLTYDGWGLLSTLLPRQQHIEFKQTLKDLKQNWPLEQEYNEEDCWELFTQDIDMEEIIPEFEVSIKEGNFGGEVGRQKCINLKFITAKWNFEVKFMAEKQKIDKGNLVAIAARKVAKQIEDFDDVDHLEIPRTLMKPVTQMMEDLRWVSTYAIYGTTVKIVRKRREEFNYM